MPHADISRSVMAPSLSCLQAAARFLVDQLYTGLFTFAHSPKHIGLYQKCGFWPRFLTATMSKPVAPGTRRGSWTQYAELPERAQAVCLRACRAVTESVYPGLDVEREIRAVHAPALGDTVLLWEEEVYG